MGLNLWRWLCFFGLSVSLLSAQAQEFIVVQSTTSTQNSGLYDAILPRFSAKAGYEVQVVAVGTGQAIKNAEHCDGDLLIVHAQAAEEAFVAAGYGLARHDLMYNDFVLIGPRSDPAGLGQTEDIAAALRALSHSGVPFVSRGDDSGTHKKELALWQSVELTVGPRLSWYRETGSGMGATLNIAVGMNAYTLSDRATWIAFANKANHGIVFEANPALFNQYGVVTLNPEHCPKAKHDLAQGFVDWLLSGEGQAAIGAYQRGGQPLFFPNARGVSPIVPAPEAASN